MTLQAATDILYQGSLSNHPSVTIFCVSPWTIKTAFRSQDIKINFQNLLILFHLQIRILNMQGKRKVTPGVKDSYLLSKWNSDYIWDLR